MAHGDHGSRSRSPDRSHKRRRRHSRSPHTKHVQRPLPFNARELTRHDLRTYRPMFTLYLDIQKQMDIEELDEAEVKGRWKSFVNKWNRGELAQGWYDPATLTKAISADEPAPKHPDRSPTTTDSRQPYPAAPQSDSEDDFGPSLPASKALATQNPSSASAYNRQPGPSIPNTSDLQAHREQAAEDAATARSDAATALRAERKAERTLQKERLDDLAPRAEPGSRERQLEKKRDAAAANKAFANAAHESGDTELRDADVMGDADSLGELKRTVKEQERKKNDRELRREEMLRARKAEREERMAVVRDKEAKTIEMLRELAQARFGGGGTAGNGG